jgi:hypothetical protein
MNIDKMPFVGEWRAADPLRHTGRQPTERTQRLVAPFGAPATGPASIVALWWQSPGGAIDQQAPAPMRAHMPDMRPAGSLSRRPPPRGARGCRTADRLAE